nr:hypothetical protein [Actinomycetota bacterium]
MKINLQNTLYLQAGLTAVFSVASPTPAWVVLQLALAAAAVGVSLSLARLGAQGRTAVLALEAVALVIGVLGLTQHHYVPGTIIGLQVLFTVFNHRPAQE